MSKQELDEGISAAHDDAFTPPPGSREFCHLHEGGSFHAVLDTPIEEEHHRVLAIHFRRCRRQRMIRTIQGGRPS